MVMTNLTFVCDRSRDVAMATKFLSKSAKSHTNFVSYGSVTPKFARLVCVLNRQFMQSSVFCGLPLRYSGVAGRAHAWLCHTFSSVLSLDVVFIISQLQL